MWDVDRIAVIGGLLLTAGALVFTGLQIRDARLAYQATTVSQIASQSRELIWKVMEHPEIHPLILGSNASSERKQSVVAGIVINHFATIYDLWELGGIPDDVWESFAIDIRDTIRAPSFQKRWNTLKKFHKKSFVEFVDAPN